MINRILSFRRRDRIEDRRAGAPIRRDPTPQPRMRWL